MFIIIQKNSYWHLPSFELKKLYCTWNDDDFISNSFEILSYKFLIQEIVLSICQTTPVIAQHYYHYAMFKKSCRCHFLTNQEIARAERARPIGWPKEYSRTTEWRRMTHPRSYKLCGEIPPPYYFVKRSRQSRTFAEFTLRESTTEIVLH